MVRASGSFSTLVTLITCLQWFASRLPAGRRSGPSTPATAPRCRPRARGPGGRCRRRCARAVAPPPLLGDEPGPLEHGDVLLHGGEAHRVALRQRRHAVRCPRRRGRRCRAECRRQGRGRCGRRRRGAADLQPSGCTFAQNDDVRKISIYDVPDSSANREIPGGRAIHGTTERATSRRPASAFPCIVGGPLKNLSRTLVCVALSVAMLATLVPTASAFKPYTHAQPARRCSTSPMAT